jgi:transcription elongation factor SPT6
LLSCYTYIFQDTLAKEDLLNALHLEFVNRVNEVGVDVNRAIANSHTGVLVQFICGLGPRKGAALLRVSFL